ncbi:hypothetical protein ACP70R_007813 [Stipagrostis hirtigluma subsp. patula]
MATVPPRPRPLPVATAIPSSSLPPPPPPPPIPAAPPFFFLSCISPSPPSSELELPAERRPDSAMAAAPFYPLYTTALAPCSLLGDPSAPRRPLSAEPSFGHGRGSSPASSGGVLQWKSPLAKPPCQCGPPRPPAVAAAEGKGVSPRAGESRGGHGQGAR